MENLIEQLSEIAQRSTCYSDFYSKAAMVTDITKAEALICMEFGCLMDFYNWARSRVETKKEDREEKLTSKSQINNVTTLVLHPEVTALKKECETLRSRLHKKLCHYNELIYNIIPNLNAYYMLKIGSADIEYLKLKIQVLRIKRYIQLIQICLNKGEKPDFLIIELLLEQEMLQWQSKIEERINFFNESKIRINNLQWTSLNLADERLFKSLFRALVKKLHPDLNPLQTKQEEQLWHRMQKAYQEGDLNELKLISVLLEDIDQSSLLPKSSGIEKWQEIKKTLESKIQEVENEIISLKSKFPYNIKNKIYSKKWLEEENEIIFSKIKSLKAQKQQLSQILTHMKKAESLE